MFLNRLLDRATNASGVLRPAPHMASVLSDPAWGDPEQQIDGSDEPLDAVPDTALQPDQNPSGTKSPRARDVQTTLPRGTSQGTPAQQSPQTSEAKAPMRVGSETARSPLDAPEVATIETPHLHSARPTQREQSTVEDAPVTSDQAKVQPQPSRQAQRSRSTPSDQKTTNVIAPETVPHGQRTSDEHIERLLDEQAEKPQANGPEQSVEIVVEIGNINLVTPSQTEAQMPAMPLIRPRPAPRVSLGDYLSERRGGRQ